MKPYGELLRSPSAESLVNWAKEHKKAVLLLGTTPITVPLFYFADVWVVGSIAAALHDFKIQLAAFSPLISPEQKIALQGQEKMFSQVLKHPVTIGWSWLTGTSDPIKKLWLYTNAIMASAGVGTYFYWRKKGGTKNSAGKVHGLKVKDNAMYGTSRWGAQNDVAPLCDFGPPQEDQGGIVLGELEKKIIRVIPGKAPKGKPSLAGHVAVFGGTGSGKTFSFVLGNIISAAMEGQSIVCVDPKGELAATTTNWLQQKGYDVKILNLSNPATSHRWNAITECVNDAEISEMATCLIQNAGKDDSAYFLAKEIQLLEALTGLLKGDYPLEQQHLRAAMSLTACDKESLDIRFRTAYQEGKISTTIYERWRGVSSANYDHAVSGLSAKLKILTTEPLAALLSEHEINVSELGNRKTALFCVIPVSGEGKVLKPILSTFYMFLFKRLYRLADQHDGKLPVPVRFLLDEFANIGQIPGFSEIISTARSLRIEIQFILQGRSQLDDVYGPHEAKNILANCPTLQLLGVPPGDQETAKMFSSILGEAAVEGYQERENVTVPFSRYFKPREKTSNIMKRPLMTPDEISRMDPLDTIALIQWCYPLYLGKVGWIKLPQAKEIEQVGTLPVSKLVPPRSFDISLPEIMDLETNNGQVQTSSTRKTHGNTNKTALLQKWN